MKKLTLLIIICIPIVSLSQLKITHNPSAKKGDFEGVGNLRIGKTTVLYIDTIASNGGVPLKDTEYHLGNIPDKMKDSKSVKEVFELKINIENIESADYHAKMSDNVRTFYLNYYKAGGVDINNLYLTFYKDTLIEISCDDPLGLDSLTIGKAFKQKYGEPASMVTSKKPIVCQNGYGAVFNYEESSVLFTWYSKKPNITASEYYGITYKDCKSSSFNSFTITDDKKTKIVENNETRIKKSIENKKKEVDAKKLENF